MKKIPMRRCIVTNESYPKKDLIRIVKTPEGEVRVDLTGKLNGKGAYIKKTLEVVQSLKNSNILEKIFEIKIDSELYSEIEKSIVD